MYVNQTQLKHKLEGEKMNLPNLIILLTCVLKLKKQLLHKHNRPLPEQSSAPMYTQANRHLIW